MYARVKLCMPESSCVCQSQVMYTCQNSCLKRKGLGFAVEDILTKIFSQTAIIVS